MEKVGEQMSNEPIVMYDSPEAATRVDMPGWKSRLGHFYPATLSIGAESA